jgi:hypothetical protein
MLGRNRRVDRGWLVADQKITFSRGICALVGESVITIGSVRRTSWMLRLEVRIDVVGRGDERAEYLVTP